MTSPLRPLRPSPLVEQAAQHLREQITGGQWPVGTRLPGETTLARELGVGRSTVREAVRALAGAGLVRARQGAGVFVIATRPVEDWRTRLRQAAVNDVYEVRTMIEVQAARLAALRRTDEDVAVLDAAMAARTAACTRSDEEFVDADIALHAAIVAAAHNPVLTALYADFMPALREGLISLVSLLDVRAEDRERGYAAHAALVGAVKDGDPDAAVHEVRTEIAHTLRTLNGR
ncbi:FadR/GntR family transcriptional regulator [Streptomyces sp. NPDC050504]|uniref:FadR/GntR family transcriptional regulator n=1 Tax=Streptomyces sp. NPDC050504 TaxID=3365618 RepID=UPI00378A1C63